MKAKKNNIDKALERLKNFKSHHVPDLKKTIIEELNVTEINNLQDAEKYINRKKVIEGIPPINLYSMQRRWKEENQYWVNN